MWTATTKGTRNWGYGAVLLYLLLLLVPRLAAEEIPMANGSSLQGEFLGIEGETARIRTEHGELLTPLSSISAPWLAKRARDTAPLSPEAQVAALEARIAALEKLVRDLQAVLAETRAAQARAAAAPEAVSSLALSAPLPPAPVEKPVITQTGYWLSESGVRHNRTCRYYMKSQGKNCRADEGRPCAKCGG